MGTRPRAEVVVDDALVASLLADQHPDLAGRTRGPRTEGWDCVMVRLGDDLAVRLPRTARAAALVGNEQRWLPRLAGRLPVAVPVPVRLGSPSAAYPWTWSVVPWFDGVAATTVAPAARGGWAQALADVVLHLHVPAEADAPANPARGVPLAARDEDVRRRLGSGAVPSARAVRTSWDRALAAPRWPGPALWVHGDLHPANLLVRSDRLAAVLDFADLTAGDPATDLATAWLTFDAAGRRRFRERVAEGRVSDRRGGEGRVSEAGGGRVARGVDGATRTRGVDGATRTRGVDEATWTRARGWAIVLVTAMLAHSDDDPVLARLGREGLAHVLADPPP